MRHSLPLFAFMNERDQNLFHILTQVYTNPGDEFSSFAVIEAYKYKHEGKRFANILKEYEVWQVRKSFQRLAECGLIVYVRQSNYNEKDRMYRLGDPVDIARARLAGKL